MGLQSLQYCAFLVVVAAVYLHLPVRMQPVFLLGASWVFYALAMPVMLPVTIALAVFTYLCTETYDREADAGIRWNDARLAIDWPVAEPILSAKDANAPFLDDIAPGRLPTFA